MNSLKYLMAYVVPILSFLGIFLGGLFVWTPVIFAFVIVPLIEPLLHASKANYTDVEKAQRLSSKIFDFLLYLNIPIVFGMILCFSTFSLLGEYSTIETIGLIFSIGVTIGSSGINVAHELGHRESKMEKLLAKALLTPSLYLHFTVEHNLGHHKYVGTPRDPASSRFRENLYSFWIRSIVGQYRSAWGIEKRRLQRENKAIFSFNNQLLIFGLAQSIYLILIALFFTPTIMGYIIIIAIISVLLLETINYVEHYGLQREKLDNGRYETVKSTHSWNSNHQLGRIMLYELTRHSDHHFQTNKKYQILEYHKNSPQLPFGYPTSMLMATVPPLWFLIMNKEVKKYRSNLTYE